MTFSDGRHPPPIVLDGVRYQQDSPLGAQHGCHLGAYDEATGERLWIVPVDVPQTALGDVVDIPCTFKSIEAVPGQRTLALEVLHGPRYLFDIDTRTARKIAEPQFAPVDVPLPHISTDIDFDEILALKPPGWR